MTNSDDSTMVRGTVPSAPANAERDWAAGPGAAAADPTAEARGPAVAVEPDGADWFARTEGAWWVLHTRARVEKVVAAALERGGVAHFLPLVTVRHVYAKSQAVFTKPLFPCYIFLRGSDEDVLTARKTNRLANVLAVTDQGRLRKELAQIYRVLESGEAVDLYPALQPGQPCRVIRGPLKGVEGVVVLRGRKCRVHIAVSTVGQSAVVEVDAAYLEAI